MTSDFVCEKISFECGSPLELMRYSCHIMPWTAVHLQRGYRQLVQNNDVDCSERSVGKKKNLRTARNVANVKNLFRVEPKKRSDSFTVDATFIYILGICVC